MHCGQSRHPETFKEKVTFKNQSYEVGLPWKEAHDPLPDNHSLSQRRLVLVEETQPEARATRQV